jgi:TRAP-type C4-dicarboxylate transport system permease small subunit
LGSGSAFDRRLGGLTRALALVGGIAVIFIMLVTVADVTLRYLFNSPIKGTLDLTQMAMVVTVFCAIGYAGWTGRHIVVDMIPPLFPPAVERAWMALIDLVGAAFMLGIAWQSVLAAIDYAETRQISFTLHIPLHPFLAVVGVGALIYGIVLLVLATRPRKPESQTPRSEI